MNIISVCILAVLTTIISLTIKKYNPEISFIVAIVGSIVIFVTVLINLNSLKETISQVLEIASIDNSYILILVKVLGICFVTEFATDCCIDAGQKALSNNISLAGKVFVLITAIPLYQDVLETVLSLTGGSL